MGFLYVIGCHGMTKIGITTNLERRMRELRPHCIYQVFMSLEHEVLERDAHELHADKRLPQSEWFKLDQDDREELLEFLGNRSVPLTKLQTQAMVGEDMKDKVEEWAESKALKIAEERARAAEEQVESLEATIKDQEGTLAAIRENLAGAQERCEFFRVAAKQKNEALKAAEERARVLEQDKVEKVRNLTLGGIISFIVGVVIGGLVS